VNSPPALTGNQLIKALKKVGFEIVRSKCSHHFLQHSDGRCTVVPVHTGETIGRGLLARIMRDCEITSEELKKILRANKPLHRTQQ
jgi:predicted RNA binding protein YcfA (HicA-like mRNA interferase family)